MKTKHLNSFPLRADEWMSVAVDCLEFLPDEQVVEVSRGLAGCPDDPLQCKKLLYQVLVKHYGQTKRPPLLSNYFFDVYSGISELLGEKRSCCSICVHVQQNNCRVKIKITPFVGAFLVNGKLEQATEALQLSLRLQDSRSREELRRLLRFMATAAKPQEVKLHKEVSVPALVV